MGSYQECFSAYPKKATFRQVWVAPNPWPGPLSTLFKEGDQVYIVDTFTNSLGHEMARIDATGRKYRHWHDPLHVVPLDLLEEERCGTPSTSAT